MEFKLGRLKEDYHLPDLGIDVRIILKCILKIILDCGLVLCDSVPDCCDHCSVRFELYRRR
jgi:hypothetical protein